MSDIAAAQLQAEIGITRESEWLLVDQAMISGFADVTRDHQFIHVDPVRASETPFGGTIAHGFLILSLLSFLQETTVDFGDLKVRMGVNYGFDRIRFMSPVRSGRHIRLISQLATVEPKAESIFQLTHDVTVEIEGEDKPALKALWITRLTF